MPNGPIRRRSHGQRGRPFRGCGIHHFVRVNLPFYAGNAILALVTVVRAGEQYVARTAGTTLWDTDTVGVGRHQEIIPWTWRIHGRMQCPYRIISYSTLASHWLPLTSFYEQLDVLSAIDFDMESWNIFLSWYTPGGSRLTLGEGLLAGLPLISEGENVRVIAITPWPISKTKKRQNSEFSICNY